MRQPFFSVIVVAYNAENYIEDTLNSVLMQTFQDYEIIVKDAGSTDKTLERIPQDDRIRVYSTKDGGIYHGMNEAIGYAKGIYCTFLNCGDIFHNEQVLADVYAASKDCVPDNTILYGNCYRSGAYVKQPSVITDFYLFRTPLNHQSMFFGTELFSRLGLYDADLRIAADYDFTIRAFKNGVDFVYCPSTICDYLGGGASDSEKGKIIKSSDYKVIYNRHYSSAERRKYNFMLALTMKKLRQKFASDKAPRLVQKIYRGVVNLMNR